MPLYYLIYSSVPSRPLSDAELEDLLEVSRSANIRHGVTGMLLCFDEMYLQLIEGEEFEIRQLYQNLCLDARHYHVQILKEGKINQRFYPNWSMAFERKDIRPETKESSLKLFTEKSISLLTLLDSNFI